MPSLVYPLQHFLERMTAVLEENDGLPCHFHVLYSCESWTLTTELEKRLQAFEGSCYQRLLNILYKDHITDEEVCRKIQAAIFGEYD